MFFKVFKEATTISQANKYPILYKTVLFYISLLKELKAYSINNLKHILKQAAIAIYNILDDYFRKTMATRALCVITIINP